MSEGNEVQEQTEELKPIKTKRIILKDVLSFILADKFEWFLSIVILLWLFTKFGYLTQPDFVGLFRWAIGGLFGAEAFNEATNFRGFKGRND